MRLAFLALVLTWGALLGSCDNCPNGNAGDSLFCHAANCAADEAICEGACANLQSDRDNCGACGTQCGDGLVCSFGQCVEGCDNGLVNCAGTCTDPAADPANCGGCSATDATHTCAPTESCNNGVCGCGESEIVCIDGCVDPNTSNTHCGASGTCGPGATGAMCANKQACLNGTCESTEIYRGSLPPTTGRFQFNAVPFLDGADAACDMAFPGSAMCTYDKLKQASMTAVPETTNAVDTNATPVSSWWVDDPNDNTDSRCIKTADQKPWSYQTADEGHKGLHVTLTPATGAIDAMPVSAVDCSVLRNVPCCSKITAP